MTNNTQKRKSDKKKSQMLGDNVDVVVTFCDILITLEEICFLLPRWRATFCNWDHQYKHDFTRMKTTDIFVYFLSKISERQKDNYLKKIINIKRFSNKNLYAQRIFLLPSNYDDGLFEVVLKLHALYITSTVCMLPPSVSMFFKRRTHYSQAIV